MNNLLNIATVTLFKKFIDHRSPVMSQPESTFYLAINHFKKCDSFWYKKQALGVNQIDKFMKSMVKNTSVIGRKTNHSARKTMVESLCRANIPDSTVMQLSGHKSIQSLNHYKTLSLAQQQSLSHLLSSYETSGTTSHNTFLQEEMRETSEEQKQTNKGGLFSNVHFDNCTFNINITPNTATTLTERRAKRARVIYDSSDEELKINTLSPVICYSSYMHVLNQLLGI